jgi:hypothetical protein
VLVGGRRLCVVLENQLGSARKFIFDSFLEVFCFSPKRFSELRAATTHISDQLFFIGFLNSSRRAGSSGGGPSGNVSREQNSFFEFCDFSLLRNISPAQKKTPDSSSSRKTGSQG